MMTISKGILGKDLTNRNLPWTLLAIWAELREGNYLPWFHSAFSVGTKLTFLDERPQTRYAQTRGLSPIQNVR